MLGPLQAYMARFKTDRTIALVRSMALKQLDGAGALAELEAYKVTRGTPRCAAAVTCCAAAEVAAVTPSNESQIVRWVYDGSAVCILGAGGVAWCVQL